jgi:hypothetical protein
MIGRTSFKTCTLIAFFLLVAMGILAACGGGSTTTSSSTSTSNGATGAGTPGANGRFRPVTGTVSQYDASAKSLTIKLSSGSTQTFSTVNARIIQDQKITQQELSALLSKSGIVVFAIGQKASDGSYTAQEVIASTTMGGTANGPQGRAPRGTPPAGTTQGSPRNGGNRVFIQNGKLQNNQLIGVDSSGHTITVDLSGTTTFIGQSEAIASDFQSGQTVSIVAGSAQNSPTMEARQIVIGPLPGTRAGA